MIAVGGQKNKSTKKMIVRPAEETGRVSPGRSNGGAMAGPPPGVMGCTGVQSVPQYSQ